MIDIQEARRVTKLNRNKSPYLLRWVENYIDAKIMDAASRGRDSLCLPLSRFEPMSDEEIAAVFETYADYNPKHFCDGPNGVFYFFWD